MATANADHERTDSLAQLTPIESGSIVGLAYAQIRALILSGEMAPGDRLSQLELADRLAISRTPVREALRRLTGEGLVDALPQRGFRVADLGLDGVMRRLELRLLLEPGIARLAAERATADDLAALRGAIQFETVARESNAAHDASRLFHMSVARATHNDELVNTLDAKWIVEVGRRLLARRATTADWKKTDVSEHTAIADAIENGDGHRAERLTREHIAAALKHWDPFSGAATNAPTAD
jgi:DNA-binding GntR family transcriptional regulator